MSQQDPAAISERLLRGELKVGQRVRTLRPTTEDREWPLPHTRQFGVIGMIARVVRGPYGLCYIVRFTVPLSMSAAAPHDHRFADYAPDELEPIDEED